MNRIFQHKNQGEIEQLRTELERKDAELEALRASAGHNRATEQALRESESRHAFLLRLGDACRKLLDPRRIQAVTAEMLGHYLGVSRVLYGEMLDGDLLRVDADYSATGIPSFTGEYHMAQSGAAVLEALRSGRTLAVSDITLNPRLSDEERAGYASLRIAAYAVVPLLKEGRLVALLAVQQARPRQWSADELTLLEDVAERTWATVERAHAEAEVIRANRELKKADRQKDEFLAMLAHELRNPLAAIAYVLRYLEETAGEQENLRPSLDILLRQTRSLRTLVDQLLDVSRMTRGLIELHKEPIDFAAHTRHGVASLQPQADEKGQSLRLNLPSTPLVVLADPVRLEQIVVNLLSNAIKFTAPQGEITVDLERIEGWAELRISDTGVGLQADMLDSVFDLFQQADQGLARAEGGLGIGLTIVKRLVELHGGSVTAHSEGLGQGALFVVRLPLLPTEELPAPPPDERPVASPRRVLVVDDSQDVAEALGTLLGLAGHEVRVANSGDAALAEVEDFHPEFVLLDIGMPGMDGFELAERLRHKPDLAGIRLAALTGYEQSRDPSRVQAAGLDAYFVKPVDLNALLAFIQGEAQPKREGRD